VLDKGDVSLGKVVLQVKDKEAVLIGFAFDKIFGDKADTEIVFDHWKDLRSGNGLNIGGKADALFGEEIGVEIVGLGAGGERDEGIILKVAEGDGSLCQFRECTSANCNVVNCFEGTLFKIFVGDRGGKHHGEIHQRIFQSIESLRGGVVGEADAYTGIELTETLEHRQQEAVNGNIAHTDGYNTAVKTFVKGKFILTGLDVLKGNADVSIELFAFGSELNTAVGADEKCASQLRLKVFDGSCDVGLVVQQNLSRLGKAFVLCNIVKYTVAVVTYIQLRTPLANFDYIKRVY